MGAEFWEWRAGRAAQIDDLREGRSRSPQQSGSKGQLRPDVEVVEPSDTSQLVSQSAGGQPTRQLGQAVNQLSSQPSIKGSQSNQSIQRRTTRRRSRGSVLRSLGRQRCLGAGPHVGLGRASRVAVQGQASVDTPVRAGKFNQRQHFKKNE